MCFLPAWAFSPGTDHSACTRHDKDLTADTITGSSWTDTTIGVFLEMNTSPGTAAAGSEAFFQIVRNPLKFRLFMLKNLPAAYFSGLRLESVDEAHCAVSVPFKWFTKNPFRSTYFACLSMAAEMSTGVLAMAAIHKRSPGVSMLVIGNEGKFFKKATGLITFRCNDGGLIRDAVEQSIQTGEGQTVTVQSVGTNAGGEVVARFSFTWSFKQKTKPTGS